MPGSCTPSKMREKAAAEGRGQIRDGGHGHNGLRRYCLADFVEKVGGHEVERTGPLDSGHKVGLGVCGGGGDEAGVEGCAN